MWKIVGDHYETLDGNWKLIVNDETRVYYLIGQDEVFSSEPTDLFSALDNASDMVDKLAMSK